MEFREEEGEGRHEGKDGVRQVDGRCMKKQVGHVGLQEVNDGGKR